MQISIYKVQEEPIGTGGMGCVYLGYDPKGNKVAIKELRPEFVADANMRARFHQEIDLMDKFDHPAIVKMIASFDWNESLYIVMEYIEGVTLDKYVKSKGRLTEEEAVNILLKILDALGHTHTSNIVHRDIKPSNIMVRDAKQKVCLLDFGIAKDLNSKGLTTGYQTIGTDGYMSPEQAEGYNINHLSDIYSLGCLLYFMLTGQHAFTKQANDIATRMTIINNKFPRAKDINQNISDKIQKILDKATDKNMKLRFQSCNEFSKEILNNSATIILDSYTNPRISVGRVNCDITIYDPERKVSSHHADIEKITSTGGSTEYRYIDRSTNGTLIDGHKTHNQSSVVWFEPPCFSSARRAPYPQIHLACISKYNLDWREVLNTFNNLNKNGILRDPPEEEIQPDSVTTPSSKKTNDDNLSTGWILLSILFPIVGWVMYYQWKELYPVKAKKIVITAWISFFIGVVINFIIRLS